MVEHSPLGIVLHEDGKMTVKCTCGSIATGEEGTPWETKVEDGFVVTTPSIDMPDHFHTTNPSQPIKLFDTIADMWRFNG